MRSRRAGPAILGVLLLLAACKPTPVSQSAAAPEAAAPSHLQAASAGYTLHIVFHGLVAYAQGSGKLWAFLVNANYNPKNLKADDLPPHVFQELQSVLPPTDRPAWLHDRVPPHRPHIRFQNAKVTGSFSGDPKMGRPIPGADLRFDTGLRTLGAVKLGQIANAALIVAARTGLSHQQQALSTLDQVDPLLLPPASGLDKRLAARALIEGGDVTAKLVNTCGLMFYSFKLASEPGCPGSGLRLAEEVVVEQRGRKGQVTIDLGTGEKIFVAPKDATRPVVIEVVNQTDEQIAAAGAVNCKELSRHAEAFRWFYRLLAPSGQALLAQHYFPCVAAGLFGPPICPFKLMTIAK